MPISTTWNSRSKNMVKYVMNHTRNDNKISMSELDAQLSKLLQLLGSESKPNLTALSLRLRDLENLALTVKFLDTISRAN
jgi:hypothetical protein